MPQSTDQALVKAKRQATKGKTELAAKLYQSVLEKFPNNKRAIAGLKSLQNNTIPPPSQQQINVGQLLTFYNQSRFQDALILGEKLVTKYPQVIKVHNILGATNLKLGRLNQAKSNYIRLLKLDPNHAEGHNNLGVVLVELRRYEDAADCYRNAIRLNPKYSDAYKNLGAVLNSLGQKEQAVSHFRKSLQLQPSNLEAHIGLGNLFNDMGEFDQAISCYGKVLQINPDDLKTLNNLGRSLSCLHKYEEAITYYVKAIRLNPAYIQAHNNLATAHYNLGRWQQAAQVYLRSIQLDPNSAETYNNLGVILQKLDKPQEAIANYTKAVQIKPDYAKAHSNLCEVLEKLNRTAELAIALNNACIHCDKKNPLILLRLAQSSSRDNDYKKTLSLLESFSINSLSIDLQTLYSSLLGKAYDKLNHCDKAFIAFEKLNISIEKSVNGRKYSPDLYFDLTTALKSAWAANSAVKWPSTPNKSIDRPMVFLIGFPRSGTTLLDSILRSHPQITVIEEKGLVDRMNGQLGQIASPVNLSKLSQEKISQLRKVYFDELNKHVDQSDNHNLIIDKYPLALQHAGLINRVFPDAKFILALRHPCDCVLSCFMQDFQLNEAMVNFLSLKRSAQLYAEMMELWQCYRLSLNLNVTVVKYESLINDIKSTCLPIIDFLGLDWDDNLLNYQQTANRRKQIYTPSYNQVTQPLYQQASGRWQRYQQQLQPILPLLEPWIKKHGY